jgi:hypothetical protein
MNTQIGIIAAVISGKQKQNEDAEQPPLFHRIMEKIKFIMFVSIVPTSFAIADILPGVFVLVPPSKSSLLSWPTSSSSSPFC